MTVVLYTQRLRKVEGAILKSDYYQMIRSWSWSAIWFRVSESVPSLIEVLQPTLYHVVILVT